MIHKPRISQKRLLEAIKNSQGIIMRISSRLKVSWHTTQNAIAYYPEAKKAYEDEVNKNLDVAEDVILNSIFVNKDVSVAKWYLMNKGKKRGYGENAEIENETSDEVTTLIVENGKPLEVINLENKEENGNKDE